MRSLDDAFVRVLGEVRKDPRKIDVPTLESIGQSVEKVAAAGDQFPAEALVGHAGLKFHGKSELVADQIVARAVVLQIEYRFEQKMSDLTFDEAVRLIDAWCLQADNKKLGRLQGRLVKDLAGLRAKLDDETTVILQGMDPPPKIFADPEQVRSRLALAASYLTGELSILTGLKIAFDPKAKSWPKLRAIVDTKVAEVAAYFGELARGRLGEALAQQVTAFGSESRRLAAELRRGDEKANGAILTIGSDLRTALVGFAQHPITAIPSIRALSEQFNGIVRSIPPRGPAIELIAIG